MLGAPFVINSLRWPSVAPALSLATLLPCSLPLLLPSPRDPRQYASCLSSLQKRSLQDPKPAYQRKLYAPVQPDLEFRVWRAARRPTASHTAQRCTTRCPRGCGSSSCRQGTSRCDTATPFHCHSSTFQCLSLPCPLHFHCHSLTIHCMPCAAFVIPILDRLLSYHVYQELAKCCPDSACPPGSHARHRLCLVFQRVLTAETVPFLAVPMTQMPSATKEMKNT